MTNDLYCDFQATVQDAFSCTAKLQRKLSEDPLYLYQLANDLIEIKFDIYANG